MSRRAAAAVGLGYVGIDIIVDALEGPMLLEANARPGLAIQIANGRGLMARLREIDELLARPAEPEDDTPIIAGRIGPAPAIHRRSA
jgi:predicted ATP-grasp superfamily ATP-dependent carboligase